MLDWLNDPALQNMDPVKKELFMTAAAQVSGKSGNSMASTLMSIITSANRKGVRFTSEEVALILKIMKQGKSPEEQRQIDSTVQMVTAMMNKYQK
ncbi:MAG: hypothetical protein IJZ53_03680 [Tyzzerella sp.]|nr:hypothetical protein [Tyzzerella sp.]